MFHNMSGIFTYHNKKKIINKLKKNKIACLAEHIREEAVDQNLPHIKNYP